MNEGALNSRCYVAAVKWPNIIIKLRPLQSIKPAASVTQVISLNIYFGKHLYELLKVIHVIP